MLWGDCSRDHHRHCDHDHHHFSNAVVTTHCKEFIMNALVHISCRFGWPDLLPDIHTSPLTKIRTLKRLLDDWGIEIADRAQTFQVAREPDVIFSDCLHAVGEKSKRSQGQGLSRGHQVSLWQIWVWNWALIIGPWKKDVDLSRKKKGAEPMHEEQPEKELLEDEGK